MTEAELKALYTEGYQIIRAERLMRLRVFKRNPAKLEAKIGEMDRLLKILTDLKDALKAQLAPTHEQPRLLDVPRRATYGEAGENEKRRS